MPHESGYPGQTSTGPERESSPPPGGNQGADGSEAGQRKIQHETESQPAVGGAKRPVGNPADAGDRSAVDIERRDSVVELESDEEEKEES